MSKAIKSGLSYGSSLFFKAFFFILAFFTTVITARRAEALTWSAPSTSCTEGDVRNPPNAAGTFNQGTACSGQFSSSCTANTTNQTVSCTCSACPTAPAGYTATSDGINWYVTGNNTCTTGYWNEYYQASGALSNRSCYYNLPAGNDGTGSHAATRCYYQ